MFSISLLARLPRTDCSQRLYIFVRSSDVLEMGVRLIKHEVYEELVAFHHGCWSLLRFVFSQWYGATILEGKNISNALGTVFVTSTNSKTHTKRFQKCNSSMGVLTGRTICVYETNNQVLKIGIYQPNGSGNGLVLTDNSPLMNNSINVDQVLWHNILSQGLNGLRPCKVNWQNVFRRW